MTVQKYNGSHLDKMSENKITLLSICALLFFFSFHVPSVHLKALKLIEISLFFFFFYVWKKMMEHLTLVFSCGTMTAQIH